MKWRNSKERELLSAGGSRDVTLPGKDNPHPDLSDALQRHHRTGGADMATTTTGDAFPATGAPFPAIAAAAATDLRMRGCVDYGGRCDDVIVYDVIGACDKHRCANAAGGRLSDECPGRDDTIHVV